MNRIQYALTAVFWTLFGGLNFTGAACAQKPAVRPSVRAILARRVSLTAEKLDIGMALKRLLQQVGADYVIEGPSRGEDSFFFRSPMGGVTLSLKNVPLSIALATVLRSSGYTFKIESGVFRILRAYESMGGTGIHDPPDQPIQIQVNFISSAAAVHSLLGIPGCRPEDGVIIISRSATNTLIVSAPSTDQLGELRQALRMLDVQPRQIEIKADLVFTPAGRRTGAPFEMLTSTGRTVSGKPLTLNFMTTDTKAASASPALRNGVHRVRIMPHINGDDSVTCEADGEIDLTRRIRGKAGPRHVPRAFRGEITIRPGETRTVVSTGEKRNGVPQAELRLLLTPRLLDTWRDDNGPVRQVNTAIVLDVDNRSGVGGAKLGAFAAERIAIEMANSNRFAVLRSEEVAHTAEVLHLQPPFTPLEITRIAEQGGANVVVTGEITFVRPVQGRDAKTLMVGLRMVLQGADTGEVIARASSTAEAQAKPGQTDENAIAENAVHRAAIQMVAHLLLSMAPAATVIAVRVDGPGAGIVELNRGARDGLRAGMEMAVYRGRQRVGRIRVVRAHPTSAEATIRESSFGILPEDLARTVLATGEHPDLLVPEPKGK